MSKHNGYQLARDWFDFAFENPDLISPNDHALYFWLVEKNNRCGWVDKFSCTASESMAVCGFKTYPPYKKAFDKLVELGFVKVVVPSKNQYQCNIIALSKNNKALDKALDKALLRQSRKQVKSNRESTFDINKQVNKETKKQRTKKQSSPSEDGKKKESSISVQMEDVWKIYLQKNFDVSYMSSAKDRKILNEIAAKLLFQVNEKQKNKGIISTETDNEKIMNAWVFILNNRDKWSKFHQELKELSAINSQLITIITDSKNANSKSSRNQIDPMQLAAEAINLSRQSAQRRAHGTGEMPQD